MPADEPPESLLWRIVKKPFEWLSDKIYPYKTRLKRAIAYARFGWDNYDFDAAYLIALIVFKLERLHTLFAGKHACCIHETADIKALRLAIRLGKRLREDNYTYAHDRHDRKWGKLNMEFIPLDPEKNNGFKGSEMRAWRKNTTPDTEEQERQEFMAAVEEDDAAKERDARLFFNIIAKYYPNWWD